MPGLELRYGDRIQAWVYLNRPHNYENPGSPNSIALHRARGIDLVGRIRSARLVEILPGGCGILLEATIGSGTLLLP